MLVRARLEMRISPRYLCMMAKIMCSSRTVRTRLKQSPPDAPTQTLFCSLLSVVKGKGHRRFKPGKAASQRLQPGPPLGATTVSRLVGEMAEKEEWNSSGAVEGGGTGDTMAVRSRLT